LLEALPSVAYGPEAILVVLVAAGAGAIGCGSGWGLSAHEHWLTTARHHGARPAADGGKISDMENSEAIRR
jgi:hypothetical protein